MIQQSHYFLWLTPAESARRTLRELIDSLAQQYGGPSFEPHITLLSRLRGSATDIENKVAQLARACAPFTVRCPTLGWSDEYYRCLYLSVEKNPYLLSLRERASTDIPHAVSADFEPHVSLAYGDLAAETKLKIAAALRDTHPTSILVDRMSLFCAPGAPETWRIVNTFPFTGEREPDGRASP